MAILAQEKGENKISCYIADVSNACVIVLLNNRRGQVLGKIFGYTVFIIINF